MFQPEDEATQVEPTPEVEVVVEKPKVVTVGLSDIDWKEDHTELLKSLVEMFDFRFDEVKDKFEEALQ